MYLDNNKIDNLLMNFNLHIHKLNIIISFCEAVHQYCSQFSVKVLNNLRIKIVTSTCNNVTRGEIREQGNNLLSLNKISIYLS